MEIKPYTKNAKKHPKKQIEQIANSIKEFGMNQPIVVDKNGFIIVGHGRFEALKHLGWSNEEILNHVKVIDIPESKAKAYRLADNKLNESDWDMELVIEELKELTPEEIDLTGFEKDLIIEPDDFGTDFILPDGDKSPFQQITFTLADEQAESIRKALSEIKKTDEYKYCETFGNENSNGNALYTLISRFYGQS